MKALVITGPGRAEVQDVAEPVVEPGEVIVTVKRAGICGTDIELFTGEMAYLASGHTTYPVRIGHEWMGVVSDVGEGVSSSWIGRRVTGDTMLGCGQCRRCRSGRQHVCESRGELGIRDGRPGALAEKIMVPVTSLHALPDGVDDEMGALVEPGGNAFRAVEAAGLRPGDRCLIAGPGTIGLLCAMFAKAAGAEVHVLGAEAASLTLARNAVGVDGAWTADTLPPLEWDAAIDASNAGDLPARILDLVEPGRRVVYIGLAGTPSGIDTRELVLKDVTAVGVLSASPGLAGTIESYASGAVDPRPLIGATVTLDALPAILAGRGVESSLGRPKIQVAL